MKTEKGWVFPIIILIALLALLIFLGYMLYQYFPGEPQNLTAIIQPSKLETGNLSYKIKQFYPNMKFNHNSISYKIHLDCSDEKRERVLNAFNELSNKVGIINFNSVQDSGADIEVSCSEKTKPPVQEDFFIAGEGGAREIIKAGRYNVITSGVILLYDDVKGVKCSWPNIELHELLHVFGFGHSEDKNSLMYPYLESCDQKLDEDIISNLKELYSQENLADLYFESIEAVKKGIYLDFNATIKNSGDVDANSVVLTVFDNDEKLKDFSLNDIPFGASVIFDVAYLKLRSRSSDNIKLVIDSDNSIKEFDKENNVVELTFG